jgi:hypothetical protein
MSDIEHAPRDPFPIRLENFLVRHINQALPSARWADYLMTLYWFVRMQRRLPKRDAMLFNDVLFRIKTSDDILNPVRSFTSDKELVKQYVAAKLGEHHNVPTIAVLRSLAEVRAFDVPRHCVIKPTHLSGTVILRRDGEALDFREMESWFGKNYYRSSREANYRYLVPKVIVEPFVFDDDNPNDYKFFCAGGRASLVQVDADRKMRHTRCFYDRHWNKQPFAMTYPMLEGDVPRPANLDLMLELAGKLSADIGFVRVDFYSDGRQALVGEITHVHGNVREFFLPRTGEAEVSRMLFGT